MGRPSILVVDDSSTVRLVLKSALSEQDFDVAMCGDGQEALDWIGRNPPADLVITDLHMPNVGGIDLVSRLRGLADYAHLPIFVLTRGGDGNEKERMRDAGATAWITKPFDKDKLVNAIRKVTGRTDPIGLARVQDRSRPAKATVTFI
jgi:two-component system chemotaxis response regulator CheY